MSAFHPKLPLCGGRHAPDQAAADLQNEIDGLQRVQAIDPDNEVGDSIAIGVARDVGIANRLVGAELAGGMGECCAADERKRLVAAEEQIGVDAAEVDLVALG